MTYSQSFYVLVISLLIIWGFFSYKFFGNWPRALWDFLTLDSDLQNELTFAYREISKEKAYAKRLREYLDVTTKEIESLENKYETEKALSDLRCALMLMYKAKLDAPKEIVCYLLRHKSNPEYGDVYVAPKDKDSMCFSDDYNFKPLTWAD